MIYNNIDTMREGLEKIDRKKRIGLVPTMGALHKGHLSLIEKAASECEHVVVSIFVNPTQFGEGEDYEDYPRNLERDSELAEKTGAAMIFAPSAGEMYPEGYSTYVEVEGDKTRVLCGEKRPGHFRGVTTVVTKLFNIIRPDQAYFGRKDAQQLAVIRTLVNDLNMNIQICEVPIVREKNGLALSSRNGYLNQKEREAAVILYRALIYAGQKIRKGERRVSVLKKNIEKFINQEPLACIEYVDFYKWDTLSPLEQIEDNTLLALAVYIGDTRLIDNTVFNITSEGKVISRVNKEMKGCIRCSE